MRMMMRMIVTIMSLGPSSLLGAGFDFKGSLQYSILDATGQRIGGYRISADEWPSGVVSICLEGAERLELPFCPEYRDGENGENVKKVVSFASGGAEFLSFKIIDSQGSVRKSTVTHSDQLSADRLVFELEKINGPVKVRLLGDNRIAPFTTEGVILSFKTRSLMDSGDMVWMEENRIKRMVMESAGLENAEISGYPEVELKKFDIYQVDQRDPSRRGLMFSVYVNNDNFPLAIVANSKKWTLVLDTYGQIYDVTSSLAKIESKLTSAVLKDWVSARYPVPEGGSVNLPIAKSETVLDVSAGVIRQNESYFILPLFIQEMAVKSIASDFFETSDFDSRKVAELSRSVKLNTDDSYYSLEVDAATACSLYRSLPWTKGSKNVSVKVEFDQNCETYNIDLDAKEVIGKNSSYYLSRRTFGDSIIPETIRCGEFPEINKALLLSAKNSDFLGSRASVGYRASNGCGVIFELILTELAKEKSPAAELLRRSGFSPKAITLKLKGQTMGDFLKRKRYVLGADVSFEFIKLSVPQTYLDEAMCLWLKKKLDTNSQCRIRNQRVKIKQGKLVRMQAATAVLDFAFRQELSILGLQRVSEDPFLARVSRQLKLNHLQVRSLIEEFDNEIRGCNLKNYTDQRKTSIDYRCNIPTLTKEELWEK